MKRERKETRTIVKYTTEKAARNAYPRRIISPPSPSPCCATQMEQVGQIQRGDRWPYFYKRCRICGFTVRHILPVPKVELLEVFNGGGRMPSGNGDLRMILGGVESSG